MRTRGWRATGAADPGRALPSSYLPLFIRLVLYVPKNEQLLENLPQCENIEADLEITSHENVPIPRTVAIHNEVLVVCLGHVERGVREHVSLGPVFDEQATSDQVVACSIINLNRIGGRCERWAGGRRGRHVAFYSSPLTRNSMNKARAW